MTKLILVILIIGIFFLQKVGNHRALLRSPYDQIYNVFNSILGFIHTPLRKIVKPINIGRGLNLDVVPFITLLILLIYLSLS